MNNFQQNSVTALCPDVTIKSGNLLYEMATGTVNYKISGSLYTHYKGSAKDVSLIPAFAATTKYYAGEVIYNGGNYHRCKKTFTSLSAFDANDWFDLGSINLANEMQRMYSFAFTVGDTGDKRIIMNVSEDFSDANPFRVGDIKYVADTAPFVTIYLKNDTGSAFVPGTTELTTSGVSTQAGKMYPVGQ